MPIEIENPFAPAPAPEAAPEPNVASPQADEPVEGVPPPPPIPPEVAAVTDDEAFKASQPVEAPVEVPTTAAPGERLPEPRKPKFPFYRDLASGDVYGALRTPAGYEDDHPELYEGLNEFPKDE